MRGHSRLAIAGGVFLLAVWVYLPALHVGLVADDFRIVDRLDFEQARQALHETVGYGRNEYRPLVAFSFALSNALWDGEPFGYHLQSILLHATNVVLLFWWLCLLTKSSVMSGVAAALFAVHPIHHARITWIAARDSLPSTLFLLLAFIAYTLARQRMRPSASGNSGRLLQAVSLLCFIASLLYYEGAAVLPAVLAALEFFVFAEPEQSIGGKLRAALKHTLPFAIILGFHVGWWVLLFNGEVGQYDLDFRIGSVAGNYYTLLYQLFHGNQHLMGILYFVLLLLILFLPRDRRLLFWFALSVMGIAYTPFVIIAGFASRFAYVSAVGYVLCVALLLSGFALKGRTAPKPALRYFPVPAAAAIFLTLTWYYAAELRDRIADWKTASEIAHSIPHHVKARYPDLPDGSTLVLSRVPTMHGHAYVFPLGLKAAIGRLYEGRNVEVFYGPGDTSEIEAGKSLNPSKVIRLRFDPGRRALEEIPGGFPGPGS